MGRVQKGMRTRGLSYRLLWMLALPAMCASDARSASSAPDSATFSSSVQPFIARNCISCHNAKLKMGSVDFGSYSNAAEIAADRPTLEKMLRKLEAGEMPPPARPRPDSAELKVVTRWIDNELDRTEPDSSARSWTRRLNRSEYNRTVRDLLGVDIQAANDFPPDDSDYGFDNIANALSVSPSLMEKYMVAAERIARAAIFGPDAKNLTVTYQHAIPRRMETTNLVLVQLQANYSPTDYDVTGLSQPGSFHLTHRFPVDGEYSIRMAGTGYRPKGSEPGEMTVWLDGKLIEKFDVPVDVPSTGFEYRPDHWDFHLKVTAGEHELVAAFPHQYAGLPPAYGGLNPSKLPIPPQNDAADLSRLEKVLAKETIPEVIERRKLEIERAKQQAALPITLRKETAFPGMAMTQIEVMGPLAYTKGPSPESVRKIYVCGRPNGVHPQGCERTILTNLARRAYRRAVDAKEVDKLVAIFDAAQKSSASFDEGIAVALNAILVSPDFLFRIEGGADYGTEGPARTTSEYQLASRLSYFLWSTMPDEALLRTASEGRLHRPDVLSAESRRMLADPKSQAFVENFAGQWLETRRLKTVQPDRERFPDFDDYLAASMTQETELFVQSLIRENRSILDLIDGNYTYLNERLARHYGIRGVTGPEFRRVDLTGTGRSGILSQASVLTVSSYGNRTSPVLRGKWVLENILNAPPPPPPPNVPSLDDSAVGSSASLRQQMEAHRKNSVCASCHGRMDPLGFGLENYDAVGAWRTQDGSFPIDSSGVLPDGRTFQGPDGLKGVLKKQPKVMAEGLTEKLFIYALGRGLKRSDQAAVKQIVARATEDDYKFTTILLGVVNSAPFLQEKAVKVQEQENK
jgi:mono/diheme cytochrome c family protein